ncbi:hypothetical protein OCU04_005988 [Sclerotinia nivalis]|uniref:Uncharacterized protein n=1 Tax=Sclerotinia nivalis TaxID=352851 RepID=A0A9X0AMA3_9HELO|nr:hypothetical protein OCU04_005988 [Sclerotinia nivalis]
MKIKDESEALPSCAGDSANPPSKPRSLWSLPAQAAKFYEAMELEPDMMLISAKSSPWRTAIILDAQSTNRTILNLMIRTLGTRMKLFTEVRKRPGKSTEILAWSWLTSYGFIYLMIIPSLPVFHEEWVVTSRTLLVCINSEIKTIAYKGFWSHLEKLGGQGLPIDPELARVYLNINPEGVLLKEAHDIVEELGMVTRPFAQQSTARSAHSQAAAGEYREATAALDRADESVSQGCSIMTFTIISIIFLPMSLTNSVFGINAKEFSGSGARMSIRQ